MNSFFNIKRFGLYELRNLFFKKQTYLYLLLAFSGAYLLCFLLSVLLSQANPSAILHFGAILIILVSPCLFENKIYKQSSVFDFTLPVSTLERFLHLLLKHIILIPLIVIGSMIVLNFLAGLLSIDKTEAFVEAMSLSNWMEWGDFFKLIQLQSIFLVGYLLFKNNSFIKTLLSIIIGLILILFVTIIIFKIIFINSAIINSMGQDIDTNILIQFTSDNGISDNGIMEYLQWITMAIFPFGMWLVSYFKLREKEI